MKLTLSLVCALLGVLSSSIRAETVIKILHLQTNPKILAIWQEAAKKYESANPGVKVQFNYLENEAFKAKLPTLLQSKDRPSAFHSWGGGVMHEQVSSGICKDITKEISEGGLTRPFIPLLPKTSSSMAKPMECPTIWRRLFFGITRSCAKRPESIRPKSAMGGLR